MEHRAVSLPEPRFLLYCIGWYGIPSGMMITVPVRFEFAGQWQIVPDIDLSESDFSTLQQIIKVNLRGVNASDYRANGLYRTSSPNPHLNPNPNSTIV